MIIFIGGLPGVGKSTLTKALSERLNIFHYDVDEVKKRIYPNDPDYERNIREGSPFADATKQKVLEAVVDDFARLQPLHSRMIVEEVLQKKAQRDFLYAGAKMHFGSYCVIHITANEETVKECLSGTREGHILQQPWNVHLARKEGFDGIPEADITFENTVPLSEAIERLALLIRQHIGSE